MKEKELDSLVSRLAPAVLDEVKEFKKGKEIPNPSFEACYRQKGKWENLPRDGACGDCKYWYENLYKECKKGAFVWEYPSDKEIEQFAVGRALVAGFEAGQKKVREEIEELKKEIEEERSVLDLTDDADAAQNAVWEEVLWQYLPKLENRLRVGGKKK